VLVADVPEVALAARLGEVRELVDPHPVRGQAGADALQEHAHVVHVVEHRHAGDDPGRRGQSRRPPADHRGEEGARQADVAVGRRAERLHRLVGHLHQPELARVLAQQRAVVGADVQHHVARLQVHPRAGVGHHVRQGRHHGLLEPAAVAVGGRVQPLAVHAVRELHQRAPGAAGERQRRPVHRVQRRGGPVGKTQKAQVDDRGLKVGGAAGAAGGDLADHPSPPSPASIASQRSTTCAQELRAARAREASRIAASRSASPRMAAMLSAQSWASKRRASSGR
jgi:hypothetical protein